jgi:hypothetical protein
MSFKKGNDHLVFDLGLTNDEAIDVTADALETTPDELRKALEFSRQLLMNAQRQGLTEDQLMSVALSVVSLLVKECGPPKEQAELCMKLCNNLLAVCENLRQVEQNEPSAVMRLVASDFTIVH